jgi:DNA polymerase V
MRDGRVALVPRNRTMKPIPLREGQELLVWGVVTSCIHQFRR